MTKPKQTTVDTLLADTVELVNHSLASDATRAQAIRIAYEVGKADGRLEGAKTMGEHLTATLDKLK